VPECFNRGYIDEHLKELVTSVDFLTNAAPKFRESWEQFLTTKIISNGEECSASFPLSNLQPKKGYVEQMSLRVDDKGRMEGLSYSFKEAIGAPLFSSALVQVSPIVVAPGPLISDKDKRPATSIPEEEPAQEESQSFIRKYWWVILGAILLSSVFSQPQEQGSGTSASSSST